MSDDTAREISEIKETIARQDERIKTLYNRVNKQDELIGTVNKLAISVGRIADGQETIKRDIGGLRCDLDDIKGKPAKRWDAVILAAISAIVAYIIGRITKGV